MQEAESDSIQPVTSPPAGISRLTLFCIVAGTLLVLSAVAFFEMFATYNFAWWFYVLLAAPACILLLLRFRLRELPLRLLACSLICFFAATLYNDGFDPRRKQFLRDLDTIKLGMSESEVRRIMGDYSEGTGWNFPAANGPAQELTIQDSIVFRHNDSADWGIVTFKDGLVSNVQFSPD